MDGAVELRQLAHLLRTGADLAADVATLRASDAAELFELIEKALGLAERLDAIASRPPMASRPPKVEGAGSDLPAPKPDRDG